jgi:hypothetical protein
MEKSKLQIWAEVVARRRKFIIDELIYSGGYYEAGKVRDVIFSGTYQGKPAVLKAYDNPRLSDEPLSLKRFNESNKSEILTAPELYDYEMVNPKKGWLIMEKLPAGGSFFQPPLSPEDRQEFLKVFIEYRSNFPYEPTRETSLAENLPASEFHVHRISGWFRLANDKEAELAARGEQRVIDRETFLPKYIKALDKIRRDFAGRKMVWCHGHAKPQEFYRASERTYLTDFAHTKLYPEGYELAFVVWADHLMAADWKLDYQEWKRGVFTWVDDLELIAERLGIADYREVFKTCLVERVLGTILADVCASDRPREEKRLRLALLNQLLSELLDQLE